MISHKNIKVVLLPSKAERRCVECREVKATEDFSHKRSPWCVACEDDIHQAKTKAKAARDEAAVLESYLKSKYQLTTAELNEMYASQDGKCAICRSPKPLRGRDGLCVDHCHKTMRVRGLLCQKCNIAIGMLADSTKILRSAIRYLSK